MRSTPIIYNTRPVSAWSRSSTSCRSGASSCGAGNTWSACTPRSQTRTLTRPLPSTRNLRCIPPDRRLVPRLHLPCFLLSFDASLFRQPAQSQTPPFSARLALQHPHLQPRQSSSSPSCDSAFRSASAPCSVCSPSAIAAQPASFIHFIANHSTTKRAPLRSFMTRSTRRVRWKISSTVIRKPTIPSKTSLCELKMT